MSEIFDAEENYRTVDIFILNKKFPVSNLLNLSKDDLITLIKQTDEFKPFSSLDLIFKNWKNYDKGYEIDGDFKLYSDKVVLNSGYSYDLGVISDLTKSGVFGTLQNIATGAAQISDIISKVNDDGKKIINGNNFKYQDRVNIYKNIPYFKDISTSTLSSLSLEFNWGQNKLYNCELEVVRPIFAIANALGAKINEEGFVETPFANKYEVITNAYKSLFSGVAGEVSNVIKNLRKKESDSSAENNYSIQKLTSSLNDIYMNVTGSTELKSVVLRVAGGIIGPVYISDISWEFDWTQHDEYGMPYKGKLNLGGITPVLIEDFDKMKLTGGLQ